MAGLMQTDIIQAAKVFQNSVQSNIGDLFAPIAHGWHQAMTVAPPDTPPATSADYQDGIDDNELSTHTPQR